MNKAACLLSFIALALFASGCDTPDKPESQQARPVESKFVDLNDSRNLVPVFLSSVTNPDDALLHRLLLKTDPEYARANKFGQQDAFAGKKARLLKAASAVKGKMVLVNLTGVLRAEDYDQESQSYTLIQGHNFFFDQRVWRTDPAFEVRLVFNEPPKKLAASEAVARAISSVNDGWDNTVIRMVANVVPRSRDAISEDWNDLSNATRLHLTPIEGAVHVKSPQGGLVRVCTMVFGDAAKAATR